MTKNGLLLLALMASSLLDTLAQHPIAAQTTRPTQTLRAATAHHPATRPNQTLHPTPGGVQFNSSDTALVRAFDWAKAQALHYKGKPGDPVGPWYESALPPRDAFCMRDVAHQAIGAAIALHDTARTRRTIDHLASRHWNMENNSYLPYLYYREGRWDTARSTLLCIADPTTKRREYPEVSFGVVQAVVLGLMGVDPLPDGKTVTTLYRSHGPDSAWLTGLPILGTNLDIRHSSPFETTVANTGKRPVIWRALFYGSFTHATIRPFQADRTVTNHLLRFVKIYFE